MKNLKTTLAFLGLALLTISCSKSDDTPLPIAPPVAVTPPPTVTVVTLAGNENQGFANGQGSLAQFKNPQELVVNSSGDIFVTDTFDNRIRKITSQGLVSTFAGTGVTGTQDSGNAVGALPTFYAPVGLVLSSNGDFFVADVGINTLRKITSTGFVTTPQLTNSNGNISQITTGFQGQTMANDSQNNLYFFANYKIYKITPAGFVTTLAGVGTVGYTDGVGSGLNAVAQFGNADGVVADAAGNLYVADGYKIRKVTPSGIVSTLAGGVTQGLADGQGSVAGFYYAKKIAIDGSGNLYVADNNRIRKITPSGLVTTLVGSTETGSYVDGVNNVVRFKNLKGITCNNAGTVLFVSDEYKIRKVVISN